MAIKTRSQLLADITSAITTNDNEEITGAILNQILDDLVDSCVISLTDTSLFQGLIRFDVASAYNEGTATIYENEVYISNQSVSAGAFDSLQWWKLTELTFYTDFNATIYDNGITYTTDEIVVYNGAYFKCDVASSVGVTPIDSDPNWTEVKLATGTFGAGWITKTFFLNGNVVSYSNKLYVCTNDTSSDPFYSSSDPLTDSTNWTQFNSSPSGGFDVKTKSVDFNGVDGETYLVDTSSGDVTCTLPAPSLNAFLRFKNTDGTNNLIVAPNGGETIEFVAGNYTSTSTGDGFVVFSDGSNWFVI